MLAGGAGWSRADQGASPTTLKAHGVEVRVWRDGLRYEIRGANGAVPAHARSGLQLGVEDANVVSVKNKAADSVVVTAETKSGARAKVAIHILPHEVEFTVTPEQNDEAILLRSGGAAPGFGLGDHAVVGRKEFDTDVTGYDNEHFLSGQGLSRLVSNFVIYPKSGFAFLVWDPQMKIVRTTEQESAQGVRDANGPVRFTYFLGTPREIYRAYLAARNNSAYPVMLPKYRFFGVGWEAFGALGWDTNQKTITESVDRYLALGYPLEWMVVGSGFWPNEEDKFHATTSFGMWDAARYPQPREFIKHFRDKGLLFFLGLRISFLTDGPFSAEGVTNGYFLQKDGKAQIFKLAWPKTPCYLLDAQNPKAVDWYLRLVKKWTDYGVDGFKEDLYGYGGYGLRDDKLDPVNQALMRAGIYVMGRNEYLGSPADLHRINDFNYNQNQDRGPVNALALAYTSLPLIYPDIVGGTFGEHRFDTTVTLRMKTYMMRNAQWASVHSSMGMGQPPWSFHDEQVSRVMLDAAKLHERLHPYLYSQAVRWFHDGYPWTMAPLPVAYPQDSNTYGRENEKMRGYEWMIGDALLAAPLYGNDYETATSRDIYLPAGVWMDYDTGQRYDGGRVLKNFPLPVGKTPLFVGGTGIVVENRGGRLVCRVYPVTKNSQTEFWDRDGKTESRIEVKVKDWEHAKAIQAKTKQSAAGKWVEHAFEFPIEPGVTYEVH